MGDRPFSGVSVGLAIWSPSALYLGLFAAAAGLPIWKPENDRGDL